MEYIFDILDSLTGIFPQTESC